MRRASETTCENLRGPASPRVLLKIKPWTRTGRIVFVSKIQGTVIAPEGGWKPSTYYLVEVSFRSTNPIHHAIFYTGFLDQEGQPENYSCLFNPTWEPEVRTAPNTTDYPRHCWYDEVYFLAPVREIVSETEARDIGRAVMMPDDRMRQKREKTSGGNV